MWEFQLLDQVLHMVIAVSQHLKMLKEAGIVQGEIDSPCTCYWLSRDGCVLLFDSTVRCRDLAVLRRSVTALLVNLANGTTRDFAAASNTLNFRVSVFREPEFFSLFIVCTLRSSAVG